MKRLLISIGLVLSLVASPALAQEVSSPKYMMRFGPSSNELIPEPGNVTTPGGGTTQPEPGELTVTMRDVIVDTNVTGTQELEFKASVSGLANHQVSFSWHNLLIWGDVRLSAGRLIDVFYRSGTQGDYDSDLLAADKRPYVEATENLTGKKGRAYFRIYIKALPAPPPAPVWTISYPDIYLTVGEEVRLPKAVVLKDGTPTSYGSARFWLTDVPPGLTGGYDGLAGVPTETGTFTASVEAHGGSVPAGTKGTLKIIVQDQEPAFRYFRMVMDMSQTVSLQAYMSEIVFLDTNGARIPKWSGADYPATSNLFLSPRNGLGDGNLMAQDVMICLKADCSGPKSFPIDFVFDFGPNKARPKKVTIHEPSPNLDYYQAVHSNSINGFYGSDDGITWSYISYRTTKSPSSFYGETNILINGYKNL